MSERIVVIGAGPSGITAAKHLLEVGMDVTVLDRGAEVGGNWVFAADSGHSSVMSTTHIISSKAYSQYEDWPMPEDWPEYPHHSQLKTYFQSYAEHFGVTARCRFGRLVTRCEPVDGGGWRIHHRDDADPDDAGEVIEADRLVVCNGHHWKPRWPEYPGTFDGQLLHSHDVKSNEGLRDQRVLVIGGGNSACDVAVEASRVAASTDLSWRRGYWIVPKFLLGRPSDQLHATAHRWLGFIPLPIRLRLLERLLTTLIGTHERYGLPAPDHHLGETHPTVNSELLYFLRHGRITPRGDIARLDGRTVCFKDGSNADYDVIVACTGYHISHPFLDRSVIDLGAGPVPLYLKMIPAHRDDLAFVGLIQPLGCIWPLAELQSRLLSRWWTGRWAPPADREAAIAHELAHPDVQQISSPRHTITVDQPTFDARLRRILQEAA